MEEKNQLCHNHSKMFKIHDKEDEILTETMLGKDGIQLNSSWVLLRSSFPFQGCLWSHTYTFHQHLWNEDKVGSKHFTQ